ncbi:hypothetical protein ASD44_09780 [Mesorhizobium sp. Root554]|uniref:hypothetical protein n=1 Tax=unclassified Mesorhizobium TaxID=325217 RepID=UPI0006FEF380|nr:MULTISPECIES: hypothetical protein [unclassified Mesorhizobium]KQZ14330.1 hypothetical protein ASD27_09790 [Mesorhizobium sp. Root1471]KQZ36841.1 hypothetical protein ASD44_09780 [Mesorhizobium sp. Root554]
MAMASRADSAKLPPPLLVWREQSELDHLEDECQALKTRIASLRPHSHYRIELEARLRGLRSRQIRLECELRGRA